MNRRQFLRGTIAAAWATLPGAGLLVPNVAGANTQDFWTRDRVLWVRRQETGEQFRVVYWTDGTVDVANYIRLCYLLRDVPEDQTVVMDVNLLNLMYGIQYWNELLFGRPVPYVVSSGQRMPAHNAQVEGAAMDSLHQYGRAIDGHIPGVSPPTLAAQAAFFGFGGVGTYKTHTHIDTGRIRYWDGRKRQRKTVVRHQPNPQAVSLAR